MRKSTLTKKQQQVYEFIKDKVVAEGHAPTLGEIAGKIEAASIRSVTQYLEALERKGLIKRNRYAQRGIELIEDPGTENEFISLPVFASAGCGSPSIIAERTFDEYVTVASSFIKGQGSDLFVIRATGESMVDAGIPDGSFVLVKMTENISPNDLVVAIIEDTAVIKKISFADNAVVLSPVSKDKSYQPIIILEKDFKIFGKVVKVIKVEAEDDYQVVPLDQPVG
jgi:repressor LexA